MDEKQNIILSVLYLLEKIWGRTYLQKFLYLLNREVFNEKLFDYEPYKYGPFCSDINEDLADLENEGLIEEIPELTRGLETAYTYSLTEKGKSITEDIFNKKLNASMRSKLIEYTNKFRHYTPTELLKYVYEKYPEVTENSEFEDEYS